MKTGQSPYYNWYSIRRYIAYGGKLDPRPMTQEAVSLAVRDVYREKASGWIAESEEIKSRAEEVCRKVGLEIEDILEGRV